MNDKIRELLENAEKTDSLAKLKWRIENREQLRKERKEKLKELMEKDKQQTAVQQLIEHQRHLLYELKCGQIQIDEYEYYMSQILREAKETQDDQMICFALVCQDMSDISVVDKFKELYGNDKQ
jgi:hypothetical protein